MRQVKRNLFSSYTAATTLRQQAMCRLWETRFGGNGKTSYFEWDSKANSKPRGVNDKWRPVNTALKRQ